MSDKVLVGFDTLIDLMQAEKAQLADQVKEAILNDQLIEAGRTFTKVKRIEELIMQIRGLREAWGQIDKTLVSSLDRREPFNTVAEQIQIDEKYTPEINMVDRLFGGKKPRQIRYRQHVNKTPERAFHIPILEVLEQLGGSGYPSEVRKLVYSKMRDQLTEDDLKPLPSGQDFRWSNTVMWARFNMVKQGLLRSDSPTGVWEISDLGRTFLAQARQQGEKGETE